MNAAEIVLFESKDGTVKLLVEADVSRNKVWLTQSQMALLFDTSKQNVSLHLINCFKEGELLRMESAIGRKPTPLMQSSLSATASSPKEVSSSAAGQPTYCTATSSTDPRRTSNACASSARRSAS